MARVSRHNLQGSVVAYLPTPAAPLPVALIVIRNRRGHSREWLSTEISLPDDEMVPLQGNDGTLKPSSKSANPFWDSPESFRVGPMMP